MTLALECGHFWFHYNCDVRNDAHIASTGVRLYQRTSRVATSKNETGN